MYRVNETITGYDLAELLHGESGIFEGTSPSGERFRHGPAHFLRPGPARTEFGFLTTAYFSPMTFNPLSQCSRLVTQSCTLRARKWPLIAKR